MVLCSCVSLEHVPHQPFVFSVVRHSVWFSVMEDDEEEFPNTRTDDFLHNNNGKEKREDLWIFTSLHCF